jgi:Fe-S cluster assembly iron-binding protein IscA
VIADFLPVCHFLNYVGQLVPPRVPPDYALDSENAPLLIDLSGYQALKGNIVDYYETEHQRDSTTENAWNLKITRADS